MSFPEIALSKIVWKLKFRQVGKNSTVLILGSRAGSFFRNQRFFETFCEFGDPSFGSLTRIEQFGKIYQILNQGIFTANDIDALLHDFAGEFNQADLYLAELVRLGVFKTIISTNVDNAFEQALERVAGPPGWSFDVYNCTRLENIEYIRPERPDYCRVIKVFGRLESYGYTVARTAYMQRHPQLAPFLEQLLSSKVLAIGLDPVWDAELCRIIPASDNEFWFVNHQEPEGYMLPEHIQLGYRVECFTKDGLGYYDSFVALLHEQIISNRRSDSQIDQPLAPGESVFPRLFSPLFDPFKEQVETVTSTVLTTPMLSGKQDRSRAPLDTLVVYATKDTRMFKNLKEHIAILSFKKIVTLREINELQAGQHTPQRITGHMGYADIILLLFSASFLETYYFDLLELQNSIDQLPTKSIKVIPIILRPADWRTAPFGDLTALPTGGKPILEWPNRDKAFVNVVEGLRATIDDLH